MQHTFSLGLEPQVSLTHVNGDIEIQGWDRQEISLDWDERAGTVHQEGNALIVTYCPGDVGLRVPYATGLRVEELGGDVTAQNIRRIELKNVRGDVTLAGIGVDTSPEQSTEAISLTDIGGNVHVQKAPAVRMYRKIGGHAEVQDVALIEVEAIGADLSICRAETVAAGNVGGDLEVSDLSAVLRCGNVGGDCEVRSSPQAEVDLGNVGGDLEIAGALQARVSNTGADASICDVQGDVSIGNIGGDIDLTGMGGDLKVGRVGADALLHGLRGSVYVGGVGGDLDLQAAFAPASRGHIHVGGDASVALPEDANLTLQATVGGSITHTALSFGHGGNLVRLVYGEGAAHVHVSVGGDLTLSGGGNPQMSGAGAPWWEFGQEMARMGQELGEEFRKTFCDLGGIALTDEIGRRVEEQVRRTREKVERSARRAEERARRGAEQGRVRMQSNEREWSMSPARLDDLVNRARQAAMEGVAGAMEAVERAVNNLRVPTAPYPPRADSRPAPAAPQTPEPAEEPHLEQERETILRMIAQGRLTPEEGDMLLGGLEA